MVPYATILIPLYVVLGKLGLQNSLIGLSLVLIMFQLPFSVFMMRNAFESLPRELEEAALVDGCGTFAALTRILIHGVRPALITVGLFAFLASWNDFFAPLILLSDGDKFTLPVAVVSIREQSFGVDRLRRAGGRRDGDGDPMRRAVPGAAAPLRPRIHDRSPAVTLQELGARRDRGRLLGRARQQLNRDVLIPDGERRLEAAGQLRQPARRRGARTAFRGMVFHDSDVYKWLEALGYELAREPSPELARMADETIELLEAAQCDDGYLNSYYQVADPGPRWSNLAWDHELYCAGPPVRGGRRAPGRRAAARRRAPLRRPARGRLPRRAARAGTRRSSSGS